MDARQARLERTHRWRQAAVWAPVVWLPLALFWLLTGRAPLAVAIALAGVVFAGIARLVVWAGRCPGCGVPTRSSPAGFRALWDEMRCAACGLSLFELRRSRARD